MNALLRRTLLLCAATLTLGAANRIAYSELHTLEKSFDRRIAA